MTESARWQLHRAGIANVYQYENEILTFRDGRLLLRGVNGSGKSTAMNMLLPFLLTGKTRGIDAAGEQAGVLKSWMLSGREEKQPVGYLWLEFIRETGDTKETLALGCGIKASRASDTVNTWWFITSRRPGIDFDLLEQQIPLSLDSLRHALAPDPVYTQDRRGDYRNEVARRLYGGASNESFLDLLNTVRNPRVGDRVDVDLPAYLVSALPNLSETALMEAARPLDDLDEHRRNVADLQTTEAGLAGIASVYKQYVVAELHRELANAKQTLSHARHSRTASEAANEAWQEAVSAEAQAKDKLQTLRSTIEHCVQQIDALERSSAYTEGLQLEDLRRHVISLEQQLQKDKGRFERLHDRQPGIVESVQQKERQADERWQQLANRTRELATLTTELTLDQQPATINPIPRLAVESSHTVAALNEPLEMFDAQASRQQLSAVSGAASTRQLDIDEAQAQFNKRDDAITQLQHARSAQELAIETVEDATSRFDTGRQQLQQHTQKWCNITEGWIDRTRQTVKNAPVITGFTQAQGTILNGVDVTPGSDLEALRQALNDGIDSTVDQQSQILASLNVNIKQAAEEQQIAQAELDRLNALSEPEVPQLEWQQRKGISFADCIDFKEGVSATQRAGLEAALQASGILLASVASEGVTLANGALIVGTDKPVPQPLSTLLRAVVPNQTGLTKATIDQVLNAISTQWSDVPNPDNKSTIITDDGRFKLALLSGQHQKSTAEYIGITARRERLENLREAARNTLTLATEKLDTLRQHGKISEQYVGELQNLRASLPSLRDVQQAQATALALESELDKARERLQQKEQQLSAAERQLQEQDDTLQRLCRRLELPADQGRLRQLEQTLNRIKSDVDSLQQLALSLLQACEDWQQAVETWRTAQEDLHEAQQRFEESSVEHLQHKERLNTLESTLGVEYRQVIEQIQQFDQQQLNSKNALPAAEKASNDTIRITQAKLNNVNNTREALHHAELKCSDTYEHLRGLTQVKGLLPTLQLITETDEAVNDHTEALPIITLPLSSADTNGLKLITKALQDSLPEKPKEETTADGVRSSLRRRRNSLGAGWDAEDAQPDHRYPLSVNVNGPLGPMSLAESVDAVRTQLAQLKALLTEKQDQALRNLLQGLIAREVAEKMFQADRLITRMNDRLKSVTTSHGIGVRLRWRRSKELQTSVKETVEILAKQPDLRTEAEESSLRIALAAVLDEERRLQPDAPYRQLIAKVFDYRAWHEMDVMLRRGDDTPTRLTRKTPLSEGEKKLVSYLPLFSAVAASCDALADHGNEQVPRFLLLDDAFAKVSEDNHEALFGLLVDLDLDFIATSERLWGTHASVPALAITEVVRDTTLGTILLEHSHWDGKVLHMQAMPSLEAQVFDADNLNANGHAEHSHE
jgi:uncharacterized protein (TIGR02680 family)